VVFGIVVNKHAQRFYDEGEDIWPKRYAIWGRLVAAQPDQIAYIIFDSSVVTSFHADAVSTDRRAHHRRTRRVSSGSMRRRWKKNPRRFQRRGAARHLRPHHSRRLPHEGLTPAKTHWARKIDAPPYLAYPVRPGITFTYLGTRVNKQSRMLMKDGKPSANMFAAGEIMAGNVLGKGYAAGIGNDHRQRVRTGRRTGSGEECAELEIALALPRPACGERSTRVARRVRGLSTSTVRGDSPSPRPSPREGRGEGEEKQRGNMSRIAIAAAVVLMTTPLAKRRRTAGAARHGLVPCRRTPG